MKTKLNLITKLAALGLCIAFVFGAVALLTNGDGKPSVDGGADGGDTSGGDVQANVWSSEIVDTAKAKYTYSEMVDDLSELAAKYNGRMSYRTVGSSLDGRNIYAVTLGDPEAKNQIVISAGIHAREYMTPMLVMAQVEYYLSGYDTQSFEGVPFSEIFEEYAFVILPMCNPDGITLSQLGINAIKSEELRAQIRAIYDRDRAEGFVNGTFDDYVSTWKANARGVDLNRNFDTEDFGKSSKISRPCYMNYPGEAALSEPESRAMADTVRGLRNPVLSIAVHSQGEVVYFNCGQKNYAAALDLGIKVSDFTRYVLQYDVRRDSAFDDWCNKNIGIPSVTVETGSSPCPLPISEFDKIWKTNRDLWLFAALYHKNLD